MLHGNRNKLCSRGLNHANVKDREAYFQVTVKPWSLLIKTYRE